MRLHLVDADSGGGQIDAAKSSVSIVVQPRSNPCGRVSFASSVNTVIEPRSQLLQYIRLTRTYVLFFILQ